MASSMIHMAVAHDINKVLQRDEDKILIGSIAPDISKQIGETKLKSHFLDNDKNDIPNIDRFLNKYQKNLNDDFVMGYFIHLYTDYLWFKYFIPEIYDKPMIKKIDGSEVKCNGNMLSIYIYNDYTNLNINLIDEYDMNLNIFYNDIPYFNPIIEEIPMDKLKIIMDAVSVIIENSKTKKEFVFNISDIKQFISLSKTLILSKLKDIDSSSQEGLYEQ